LVAAVLLPLLAGCGYHVVQPGSKGTELAGKTFEVKLFANKSFRAGIEAAVTDALVDELVTREGQRVLEVGGEYVVSGTVISYGRSTVSYTATDEAKEYRASIATEAVLTRRITGQIVWKGNVSAYQDFPANTNAALQQNNEAAAIRSASLKIAQQIYLHLTENF
jgi:outer membrane lipopolysaccharide assembly protein LptE/RlpB